MKYKWTVHLLEDGQKSLKVLHYDDYDSVQNLIGYIMEGTRIQMFTIIKSEVKEEE